VAEQGHPDGMNDLGIMYMNGMRVEPDGEKAAIWMVKSLK